MIAHLLRGVARCAGRSGHAFLGSAAARLAAGFSWQLGRYDDIDPFNKYAGRGRGKGHEAGKRDSVHTLFSNAGLLRHDASH